MFDLHFNFSSIGLTSLHSVLYFYNVVQKVGMKNIAVLCSSTSFVILCFLSSSLAFFSRTRKLKID